jgi:hypothetical protein
MSGLCLLRAVEVGVEIVVPRHGIHGWHKTAAFLTIVPAVRDCCYMYPYTDNATKTGAFGLSTS